MSQFPQQPQQGQQFAPQGVPQYAPPQAPPQTPPQPQAIAQPQPTPGADEHTLNFDFNSIPDVKVPIDGGWRYMVIKTAPKIKDVQNEPGKKVFSGQAHVNEPGKRDNDETYLLYWDINDRQDQFMIKQLFYACGIDPQPGMPTSVLVNRPFQARFEQAPGKRKDGSAAIFTNLREFLVDQRFIRNIPGAAAAGQTQPAPQIAGGPAPAGQPLPPQQPQAPQQAFTQPVAPPVYQQPVPAPQQPMAPQAPQSFGPPAPLPPPPMPGGFQPNPPPIPGR